MRTPVAICITDTHLTEDTLETNRKIFSQVSQLAESLGVKTIIHKGDIFTSRKGQPEVVAVAFKEIIDSYAKAGLRMYAIPGNHDKVDGTIDRSFLLVYDGHPAFTVLESGAVMSHENIDIIFIPYFDEKLVYAEKLKQAKKLIGDKRTSILITHVGINGVRSNGGTLVDNDVTQEMFEDFTFVLVGHYHDRQLLGSREHIIYTGSAYQANFGEDDKKGCVVIYDDPFDPFEFIELDFKKYVTVDIVPADVTSDLVEMVKGKQQEANVRLKIDGEIPENTKQLVAELQKTGAKLVINKQEFAPLDVVPAQDVVISSGDILKTFDKWVKERDIKDGKYGRKILQECGEQ